MQFETNLQEKCAMMKSSIKTAIIVYVIVAIIALVIGWCYLRTANEDYHDPESLYCMCRSKSYVWWAGFFLIALAIIWFIMAIYLKMYGASSMKECI